MQEVHDKFVAAFGEKSPLHLAEAPGRVNLIGEHIDYNGYSVLPMALKQRMAMLFHVEPNESGIHLHNTSSQFLDYDSDSNEVIIDRSAPKWFHYFMCAYQGIKDYAGKHGLVFPSFKLELVAHGTVPPSAGLSSSSALVLCSALVISKCCGFDIPKREMAELCAECERYIGTQGGGMDQAVSMLAEEGKALHIVFTTPLQTELVPLPESVAIVVAHSGVTMNKSASNQFNQRVVECRIAAKLLTFLLAGEQSDWREIRRLADVQNHAVINKATATEMHAIVTELLHEEPYTREELMELLNIGTVAEFQQLMLTENTQEMREFKLRARADHVYTEAARVHEFLRLCQHYLHPEGSPTSPESPKVGEALGRLMTASHRSCSERYECSCPELDALVNVCLNAGALGARLTGAGWGGCMVAMVLKEEVQSFVESVKRDYYGQRGISGAGEQSQAEIFVTSPAKGAHLFENIHF